MTKGGEPVATDHNNRRDGSPRRSILGLIPARGASKGIPRKNLAPLGQKPLIQYTFEAALQSRLLDRVILSTDDVEIAQFGRDFGVDVPFLRPKYLATDQASTRSVQRHALRWLRDNEGYTPEAVVTLQPTSPFRRAKHIDEAVSEFRHRAMDCVVGVTPVEEHPYIMVRFIGERMLWAVDRPRKATRRQDFPPYFCINGAIYINRSLILLGKGSPYGKRVHGYVMDAVSSVDIDTPEDLEAADSLLGPDNSA